MSLAKKLEITLLCVQIANGMYEKILNLLIRVEAKKGKLKIITVTDVSELEFPIFFNHHLNSINDIGKNVTIRDTPLSPQGVCVAPIILF